MPSMRLKVLVMWAASAKPAAYAASPSGRPAAMAPPARCSLSQAR